MKLSVLLAVLVLALLLFGCAKTAPELGAVSPQDVQADSLDIPADDAPEDVNVDINDEDLAQLDM